MSTELRATTKLVPTNLPAFLNLATDTVGEAGQRLRRALGVRSLPNTPNEISQHTVSQPAKASSLEEKLYTSSASCKIRVAHVAMHLDANWRKGFFSQVDRLLSLDDWDERDIPISDGSFATLIRMLLLLRTAKRPGLGASSDGHVIAAWTTEKDRLTIECFPNDKVQWVLSRQVDGQRETAAGESYLARLESVLAPYNPQRWFANENKKNP